MNRIYHKHHTLQYTDMSTHVNFKMWLNGSDVLKYLTIFFVYVDHPCTFLNQHCFCKACEMLNIYLWSLRLLKCSHLKNFCPELGFHPRTVSHVSSNLVLTSISLSHHSLRYQSYVQLYQDICWFHTCTSYRFMIYAKNRIHSFLECCAI
jgi:hypothetical protein